MAMQAEQNELRDVILAYLHCGRRVQFWFHDQAETRIEGRILGFDKTMKVVVDDAVEILVKNNTRQAIGRILLMENNICLMSRAEKYWAPRSSSASSPSTYTAHGGWRSAGEGISGQFGAGLVPAKNRARGTQFRSGGRCATQC